MAHQLYHCPECGTFGEAFAGAIPARFPCPDCGKRSGHASPDQQAAARAEANAHPAARWAPVNAGAKHDEA